MTLPLAEVPALPLHTAGKYVAAAYIVLFAIVLIYVAIMALRLRRVERELGELVTLAAHEHPPADGHAGAVERGSTPGAVEQGSTPGAVERESTPA